MVSKKVVNGQTYVKYGGLPDGLSYEDGIFSIGDSSNSTCGLSIGGLLKINSIDQNDDPNGTSGNICLENLDKGLYTKSDKKEGNALVGYRIAHVSKSSDMDDTDFWDKNLIVHNNMEIIIGQSTSMGTNEESILQVTTISSSGIRLAEYEGNTMITKHDILASNKGLPDGISYTDGIFRITSGNSTTCGLAVDRLMMIDNRISGTNSNLFLEKLNGQVCSLMNTYIILSYDSKGSRWVDQIDEGNAVYYTCMEDDTQSYFTITDCKIDTSLPSFYYENLTSATYVKKAEEADEENSYPITEVGDDAFSGATSIKIDSLPASIQRIGNGAFYQCASLSLSALPVNLVHIGSTAFAESSIQFSSLPSNVVEIGNAAFMGCTSLRLVSLANNGFLTHIPDNAFYSCVNMPLESLPPYLQTIGEHAFQYCRSLQISKFPSSLQSIGKNAFEGCTSLRQLDMREAVNLERIDDDAFNITGSSTTCRCTVIMNNTILEKFIEMGRLTMSGNTYYLDNAKVMVVNS